MYEEDDKYNMFFSLFSEPSHQNDPIEGFQPIEEGKINFLDIINDGLYPGLDPNREANHFWADIEENI